MNPSDLLRNLDAEEFDHRNLAADAGYSVAQTYRIAARTGVRRPMTARRRVLLERAAWELIHSDRTVSQLALDAGFDSLDGFSRAFRKGFGVLPSVYRRLAPEEYRFGPRSGLHYAPGPYRVVRQGSTMSFIQRMLDSHRDETLALIENVAARPEFREVKLPLTNPFPWPWEPDDETVDQLLHRCCSGPNPWLHAIEGYTDDPNQDHRSRLLSQHEAFSKLVSGIEREGSWDVTFVDADCDPPQVFSYSSVIHHVITFNEHARITLQQRLRALGVGVGEGLPPQQ